jgi:hypothetical protein
VFAEGGSNELCRTPCAFDIDLKDGGAADRRTFVVRSPGHRDASFVVDFAGADRAFKVLLDPLQAAATHDGRPQPAFPAAGGTVAARPADAGARPTDPGTATPADKPAGPTDAKPADPAAAKPAAEGTDQPADPATTKHRGGGTTKPGHGEPTVTRPADPVIPPEKPATKPAKPKIDATDTIDPFHRP